MPLSIVIGLCMPLQHTTAGARLLGLQLYLALDACKHHVKLRKNGTVSHKSIIHVALIFKCISMYQSAFGRIYWELPSTTAAHCC